MTTVVARGVSVGVDVAAAILARSLEAHALAARVPDVVTAVRRAAGIYGAAPTCHFGLALRVAGYTPAALDRAVLVDRSLVRVSAMRGSIYLVPRDLLPHALTLGRVRWSDRDIRNAGLSLDDYRRLVDQVGEVLAERPRTAAEIRKCLGDAAPAQLSFMLGRMSRGGDIVRTRIRGGVRSQAFEYARMADWAPLPEVMPTLPEALDAWTPLWLEANGPATVADLAWWAGVTLAAANGTFKRLGVETRSVDGAAWAATPAQWQALATAPQAGPRVHLLPVWDAWLMAHKDRARYLDAAVAPYVIDKYGNVTNVILADGRVAGTWDVVDDTLLYATFGARLAKGLVAAAAQALAPVHAVAAVKKVDAPQPLTLGPQNTFLAPLKGAS